MKVAVIAVVVLVRICSCGVVPPPAPYKSPRPAGVPRAYFTAPHFAVAEVAAPPVLEYDHYVHEILDAATEEQGSAHSDGYVLTGAYSVTDPDGTRRTVDFVADPDAGFSAVVHRQPVYAPV